MSKLTVTAPNILIQNQKQTNSQQPQLGDREDDLFYLGADEERQNSYQAITGSQIIRAYGVPGITEAPSEQEFTTRVMDSHTSNILGNNNRQSSQLGSSSFSNAFTPKPTQPSQHKSVNDLNSLVITKNNNNNTLNTFYNNNSSQNVLTTNIPSNNNNNTNNNNNNNIISLMNVQNLIQLNTGTSVPSFANNNSQRLEYSNQGTGFSNGGNQDVEDNDDNEEEPASSSSKDKNYQQILQQQQSLEKQEQQQSQNVVMQQNILLTGQSHSARQMTSSTQMNKSAKTGKTTTSTSHPNNNNNNNNNNNSDGVDNRTDESLREIVPNGQSVHGGKADSKTQPLDMICPYCSEFISTQVSFSPTWKTHLASFALCLVGFPCGLCLIPYYYQRRFQTANHACSKCKQHIAEYQC